MLPESPQSRRKSGSRRTLCFRGVRNRREHGRPRPAPRSGACARRCTTAALTTRECTPTPTGVSIGMRRLSIIDLEGGHQPICNEDGTVWAVLNGEIYNHPRLQDDCSARASLRARALDTEVLVHLYEDYGEELVHALEGMFAFALWDERRGRLLLARDRFGEKPLFYARAMAS